MFTVVQDSQESYLIKALTDRFIKQKCIDF